MFKRLHALGTDDAWSDDQDAHEAHGDEHRADKVNGVVDIAAPGSAGEMQRRFHLHRLGHRQLLRLKGGGGGDGELRGGQPV